MAKTRKSLEPYLKDSIQFYDHQVDGVRKMIRLRNFLLADDMGLGKSLQAITVAAADAKRGWANKILVVAPVNLKDNWHDEFDKFTGIPATVLGHGPDPKNPERNKTLKPAERTEQLMQFYHAEGVRCLIVNYEQVVKHLAELNKIAFDIVIFDEAHYLKNHKAKRTEACHKLTYRRVFCLTGTPMLNQVNELWSLLHLIDKAAYPKYWTFVKRYCVFGGYKDKQIIGPKNERELRERLSEVMIRRMKADVLDLPDVQYIQKKIDLLPSQKKLYEQAESELAITLDGNPEPTEIENALTKLLRLKQICGTTLPFNGKDESAKLDVAIEDAMELLRNGHKIVVFTQFRPVLEAFCQRLQKEIDAERKTRKLSADPFDMWELHGDIPKHERQPAVRQWSADSKPGALVCMLQVAGVGLNMTASRHGLFLDKLWTPGLNQQAVDRLHRIGQSETQKVQIIEYLIRGTVETRVEQVLTLKKKVFGMIVNEADYKKKLLQALMAKGDAA